MNFKNKTYFKNIKPEKSDVLDVEIGDSKDLLNFLPQKKIMRWDNEANVSIRLKETVTELKQKATIKEEDGKIKYIKKDREAHFYDIQNEEHPEGASEFEIVLNKKPKSNVIEFTLVDKDVEYFYQPALTLEEIAEGCIRPDNVIGSYAIFTKTPKINYLGQKVYRHGKVGHIFRPKIIDSAGTEVWGELHIGNGILSVTIPQDFLNKAVYPVRHAAGLTFGYTTNGASDFSWTNNRASGTVATPASGGEVTSITVRWKTSVSNTNVKAFIVTKSDDTIIANGVSQYGTAPLDGVYRNQGYGFAANPTITAQQYCLYAIATGTGVTRIAYDTGSAGDGNYDGSNSFTTPTNPTDFVAVTRKCTIYATYTAAAGSESSSESPSASASLSPSSSASASLSPSSSSSASLSPSSSISASPSAGYKEYTKGNYATLPSTDTDLEDSYTVQNTTDIGSSNDVRVGQTGIGEYMLHQFKDNVGANTHCVLTCEVRTTLAPASSTVHLQIYNRNTSAWADVDTDNSSNADTDFTLSGSVADLTNYKDQNDVISCRVYQLAL